MGSLSARVEVAPGLLIVVLCLTGVALLLRRSVPARYGDFWRIWGEPPRMWLNLLAGGFTGCLLLDVVGPAAFPQQITVLGQRRTIVDAIAGLIGLLALAGSGIGLWWGFRKTMLR